MKITVNGVYGHMRRIENKGLNMSAFRSSGATTGKRRGRPRKQSAQSSNGHSIAVSRFMKNLADDEKALKDEADGLVRRQKRDGERLNQIGKALQGVEAARERVRS